MPAMNYALVANLYDAYAQTDIDVLFFLEEAKDCNNVLELTSGTGRLSLPLLRAGIPLTCLDNSAEMLAVLRRKLAEAELMAAVYELDASNFSLPNTYDLILIPFNAFAEFTDEAAQRSTLAAIHSHLTDSGRLIVTLHNPPVRLKGVNGQLQVRGKFGLPDGQGSLFLSSWEQHNSKTNTVEGAQFYEVYDPEGVMQAKRFVDLKFCLHSKEAFEALATSQGYKTLALYGDYGRARFDNNTSPFMIWVLGKA